MARPRGSRSILTRSARTTSWSIGPQERDGTLATTAKEAWATGVVTSANKITIVRMRGHVQSFLTTAAAAGDGFSGAWGIGLVTAAAFAVGITAMPGPITESDWDGWLWHSFFDLHVITTTLADGVNAGGVFALAVIDSKAMRKFDEDMVVFGATEVVERGTAAIETNADTRMLVKLG